MIQIGKITKNQNDLIFVLDLLDESSMTKAIYSTVIVLYLVKHAFISTRFVFVAHKNDLLVLASPVQYIHNPVFNHATSSRFYVAD